jgi:hypothetical protein
MQKIKNLEKIIVKGYVLLEIKSTNLHQPRIACVAIRREYTQFGDFTDIKRI